MTTTAKISILPMGLLLVFGLRARAEASSARPQVSCELVLEALGVESGAAKRIPLFHLGKAAMRAFGGGERVLIFGQVKDAETGEVRWVYSHVGKKRPTHLDWTKLKISKSLPGESLAARGRVSGLAEFWVDATPTVLHDLRPELAPRPALVREEVGPGSVLRDGDRFYVVRRRFEGQSIAPLEVWTYDEAPLVGAKGARGVLAFDPSLRGLRRVGSAEVDDAGLVTSVREAEEPPVVETGHLVVVPVHVGLDLTRWSTLP